MNQRVGRVRIARIKREYLPNLELTWVVDAIIFKHDRKYYRMCSYGKRLSQKGKKFSFRRWISRNTISISCLKTNNQILEETMFNTDLEYIRLTGLVAIFYHYRHYIEGCGLKFNIHLIEDFDVILD